jgi:hypothetical protein
MNLDPSEDFDQLRHHAAKLGIVLPRFVEHLPSICYGGRQLPSPFVWFCQNYAEHSGFSHQILEPDFGVLSPFGKTSALQRRNDQIRQQVPGWPSHWVSFSHGSDGDYCFSFADDGNAWVVYWYYNAGIADESAQSDFKEDYVQASFVDWFAAEVNWMLSRGGGKT